MKGRIKDKGRSGARPGGRVDGIRYRTKEEREDGEGGWVN